MALSQCIFCFQTQKERFLFGEQDKYQFIYVIYLIKTTGTHFPAPGDIFQTFRVNQQSFAFIYSLPTVKL